MNCPVCNGCGVLNRQGTQPCSYCNGHGHAPDKFSFPWPWEGAPVYAREHDVEGKGWHRILPWTLPDSQPLYAQFSPESGQRKADAFGWKVRDLDRDGNVVREYTRKRT